MSIKSFEKLYFKPILPGVLVLEFRHAANFTASFSLHRDPEELKIIYREALENIRINLLSEFDKAFIELECG